MKSKHSGLGAVLSGFCAFKCCCILPSLISLLGLTSSGAALFAARWLSPALVVLSVAMLGHSFYSMYVLKCGSRSSRCLTWASATVLILLWSARLAGPALGQGLFHPSERSSVATNGAKGTVSVPDCPCRRVQRSGPENGEMP
jgi:hypothetical protein